MLRLFTALESSVTVTNKLVNLKSNMVGTRWLNPQTLHCTLVYFGDVNVYLYRQIKQQLKHIHFTPFTVRVHQFDIFRAPDRKPHVLVALVEPNESLIELQAEIYSTISMFHPNLEMQHKFRPHISIARLSNCNVAEIQDWINENEKELDESFEINEFSLYSSRSTSSGSVFTRMDKYEMAALY